MTPLNETNQSESSDNLPITIQCKGNTFAKWLLKILGWTLDVSGLPSQRGILVAYPHTSNNDFYIGMLAKWASGISTYFLAKDSLFKIPVVGWWLFSIGGRPVIRNSPQGYVKSLAKEMVQSEYFWLAITPEGTRKYTPGWRTGFYQIAIETGYPVGFVYLDYQKKMIGLTQFRHMSGDQSLDLERIRKIYHGKVGYIPENMAPIIFWSPQSAKNDV